MFRILIADDEYRERRLLQNMLYQKFGTDIDVQSVEDGKSAAHTAILWNADIVLMDIEMPEMNGVEAAKLIRAETPTCKIIFITAYSRFEYAYEAIHLGAFDYILKPFNADKTILTIRAAMAQIDISRQLSGIGQSIETSMSENEGIEKVAQIMEKVKTYLEKNYMDHNLSLDSVSDIIKVSPSYLSQRFKLCTGMGFIESLTNIRMGAAKALLADPLKYTSEIAGMVGYDNSSYFTQLFKKKTGMTPTEYRSKLALSGQSEKGL